MNGDMIELFRNIMELVYQPKYCDYERLFVLTQVIQIYCGVEGIIDEDFDMLLVEISNSYQGPIPEEIIERTFKFVNRSEINE